MAELGTGGNKSVQIKYLKINTFSSGREKSSQCGGYGQDLGALKPPRSGPQDIALACLAFLDSVGARKKQT